MPLSKHSPSPLSQIPAGVWVLGFVSMLMDVSSEMIHSLLPMFIGHGAGHECLDRGPDRRCGRSHGADRQGVFWRAERLAGQTQRSGGAGLCHGGLDQTLVCSGADHGAGGCRPLAGPRRQRNSGCATRRLGGRHHTGGNSGSSVWVASGAGHGGGVSGARETHQAIPYTCRRVFE